MGRPRTKQARPTRHSYSTVSKTEKNVLEQREGESLKEYYTRLADTADRRLRRLEKLSQEEGFTGVKNYSYARAVRDINTYSDKDYKTARFKRNIPSSQQQLMARINDVKDFLGSVTSTKGGIVEVYQKRTNTINEKFGTDFTWQDLANYYSTEQSKINAENYGSSVIFKSLAVIKRIGSDEELIKGIEKSKSKVKMLTDDIAVQKVVNDMIRDNQTALTLFGGN